MRPTFSARDMARMLGLGKDTLLAYVRYGLLPGPIRDPVAPPNEPIRFTVEDLERYKAILPTLRPGDLARGRREYLARKADQE